MEGVKIFSGKSHRELAEKVCEKLGIALSDLKIEEFKNGCFEPILGEDIKGKIVFLFQTSRSDNRDLHKDIWELFQIINAAKSSGAKEVIVIMPYASYARSDKVHAPGMGICAELLIKLLESSGMTGFIGIDFHSGKFEKFFSTEVYQLSALDLLAEALKGINPKISFLLPADMGALKNGSILAEKLGITVGQVEKERISDTEVRIKRITGDFSGKDVIIFDDEISTGATLKTLAKEIEDKAKSISFAVTHGIFVGDSIKNFQEIKKLKEIISTDTVPASKELRESLPLRVITVAGLLAQKIKEVCKI
ncbi:MAG: ribose-phosphate diphosphokinase [Candidatus Staskawiczbacteria bacterium]|jgi:ribose-phosphate pyrophosphokinase